MPLFKEGNVFLATIIFVDHQETQYSLPFSRNPSHHSSSAAEHRLFALLQFRSENFREELDKPLS